MRSIKKPALTIAAILMLTLMANSAQLQSRRQKKAGSGEAGASATNNLQPSSTTSPVTGGGSPGKLARWAGSNSTSFVLGESSIIEDKFGKIGISTSTPTSTLTVQGMIETTLGGFKFPDGTVQTSAAIGLSSIFHDATLFGDGTSGSPLRVALPLNLTGDSSTVIVQFTNNGGGTGLRVSGGSFGIVGFGRASDSIGGTGVVGGGGGVITGSNGIAGTGVEGTGGSSFDRTGGVGVHAQGGASTVGSGGEGIRASGGQGSGAGNSGGRGISAFGGTGFDGAARGLAGFFHGDVEIIGTISKSGGSFKIDHPLDPENKYLYHSFVESPDMINVYNGNATTDANGEAVVTLPDYFQALNKEFRYQLTAVGAPGPYLYVAEEVSGNQFKIAGGTAGMKVSWQVTGIRKDAWAEQNRIPVVQEKPEPERGSYLHPEAFDKPEERGVQWARDPQLMLERKQQREEARKMGGAKRASQH